jgi:hypothetical protein
MKIEFKRVECISCCWDAKSEDRLLGKIVVDQTHPVVVHASDHTLEVPAFIKGSPFESVNQAKAALEYYFTKQKTY